MTISILTFLLFYTIINIERKIDMIKSCKLCGKLFETTKNTDVCPDVHTRECEICGKEFTLKWPYNQKTCNDSKCRAQHTRNVANSKVRTCELCGKEFIPSSPRQKYCKGPHTRICEFCGKEYVYTQNTLHSRTCGSQECKKKLRARTNLELYGVDNAMKNKEIQQRLHDNNVAKYDVGNALQRPEVKQKLMNTMLKKYGQSTNLTTPEFQEVFKQAMIERHGGQYTMNCPELRCKVVSTMLQRYGVPYYCMTDDYHKHQEHLISKINKKFGDLLENSNIPYKFEKCISNRQFDIQLLNSNVLLEIDPSITHNSYMSVFNKDSSGLDRNYHSEKSKLAKEYGFRCIHVFDWDDWNKVIQLIQPSEKLFAKNLELKEVNQEECDTFEFKYHFQGSCRNQEIKLGLYKNDEFVQIMTFGKPRYNKKYQWELLRLCTNPKYHVVGGAEKLFKHFMKLHPNESIISYCDLSKFSGEVYTRLGMKLDHVSPPAKNWSKDNRRITDNLLRQRGYDQLFKTNYGKGTSNEQLMLENGWLPVYDCGQAVFVYN